jgi:FGGY-family pentulose kinase
MTTAFLAVDVGTGSARAGIFDSTGRMLAHASHPIQTWREGGEVFEQSSTDIWRAVCHATKAALAACDADISVGGLGFTATCSLVAIGPADEPVSVSASGVAERNVILWMDHRAGDEAAFVNATHADVLDYLGGRISNEMQVPKLLWLRRHLPESWSAARHFFDLPDFLTWRATGSAARSTCSVVCKWTYLAHKGGWSDSFFRLIGLDEFVDDGYRRIGEIVLPLGSIAGVLGAEAAAELGLTAGIPVATSAIDAHAGGIGMLGIKTDDDAAGEIDFLTRLALIGGTSSCDMAVSNEPAFVPGVWGPYFSALLPGLWLNEGGQSATGALIDHVISSSAVGARLTAEARAQGTSIYDTLNDILMRLAEAENVAVGSLSHDLHVLPDFHGNRSPRADESLRGMVSGLSLADTPEALARLYLATVQAVAYGTRHIVETCNENGYGIETILACGGGTKNPLFLQQHADALGLPIVLGEEPEAVLLGAAMLASVAAGAQPSLRQAMSAMSRPQRVIRPGAGQRAYQDRKYQVFKRLYDDQMAYRALMDAAAP